MGIPKRRRSISTSLAYVGMAAATASALVVLQSTLGFAQPTVADAITVTPNSGDAVTVTEGVFAFDQLVGKFTDTGNPAGSACNAGNYEITVNWGDGSSGLADFVNCEVTNEGSTTGVFDVFGFHLYQDSGHYDISTSVVDTSEDNESSGGAVKTDTATVNDANMDVVADNSTRGSYTSVEGNSITVTVDFFDNNNQGFDKAPRASHAFQGPFRDTAGLSGTINWGDGTLLQTVQASNPSLSCECSSTFEITASHVYDAAIPATSFYNITVTGRDDGGSTATARFKATLSDGALTAGANKSLTASAAAASTSVVGTFTDEAGAQAAAADFAASVNWGDSSSSAGTVKQTASGAFSVSGSHTYAAAGSKTITATVTDQEGNSVTLHATATVGGAPAALPATGQPHQPMQPAVPVIPLALVILGLVGLAGGFSRIRTMMQR